VTASTKSGVAAALQFVIVVYHKLHRLDNRLHHEPLWPRARYSCKNLSTSLQSGVSHHGLSARDDEKVSGFNSEAALFLLLNSTGRLPWHTNLWTMRFIPMHVTEADCR
jgi:hypothetical protein